jgi:hypothetical protein
MDNLPIDNSPSYEQLAADVCAMALQLESIRKIVEGQIPSYNSVRDAIAPDCMHCRVHGRCFVSLGSAYCKHLFWCNRHP